MSKVMLEQIKLLILSLIQRKGYAIKFCIFIYNFKTNKELGLNKRMEKVYFIDDLMDDYFVKVYSERNLYLSK